MAAASDGEQRKRRVAIACQGGGSHTAFTAGVLKRLLGAGELSGYQIAGLSGTSGGAVCALLAWDALLDDAPARAGQQLEQFWTDEPAMPIHVAAGIVTPSGAWRTTARILDFTCR